MLPPNYLTRVANAIIELYERLNITITADVARRIVEAGTMTESARHQIYVLQSAGKLYDEVIKQIAALSGMPEQTIKEIFEEAAVKSLKVDDAVYKRAGLTPVPLKQSRSMLKLLTAGMQKTGGLLHNLTMTTALTAQQSYIQAANLAYMQVSSGGIDYVTAIKNAVKTAAQQGATVIYSSGHSDMLDVALRRAVLTGVSQTTGQMAMAHAGEMGCDLMELTAHGGARPSHAAWQGQVVSLSGKRGYLSLSEIGYGSGDGFKGWNCRHDWHPFYEGSSPLYSDKEIVDLNKPCIEYGGVKMTVYEAQQRQRAMERTIRQTKRELAGYDEAMKAANGDDTLRNALKSEFDKSAARLKDQQEKLNAYLQKTGLRADRARERVAEYGRSQAAKANAAGRKKP